MATTAGAGQEHVEQKLKSLSINTCTELEAIEAPPSSAKVDTPLKVDKGKDRATGPDAPQGDHDITYEDTYHDGDNTVTGVYSAVVFEECILNGAKFADCMFVGVKFLNCSFKDTMWADIYLQDVTFKDCVFEDYVWRCDKRVDYATIGQSSEKSDSHIGTEIPDEIKEDSRLKSEQAARVQVASDRKLAALLQAEENEKGAIRMSASVTKMLKRNRTPQTKLKGVDPFGNPVRRHPYFDGYYDDIDEAMDQESSVAGVSSVAAPVLSGLIDTEEKPVCEFVGHKDAVCESG